MIENSAPGNKGFDLNVYASEKFRYSYGVASSSSSRGLLEVGGRVWLSFGGILTTANGILKAHFKKQIGGNAQGDFLPRRLA